MLKRTIFIAILASLAISLPWQRGQAAFQQP